MLAQKLAAFGRGREGPVDVPRCPLRIGKRNGPRLVLFVEGHVRDRAEMVRLQQILQDPLHLRHLALRREIAAALRIFPAARKRLRKGPCHIFIAQALIHLVEVTEIVAQPLHERGQLLALDARAAFTVSE